MAKQTVKPKPERMPKGKATASGLVLAGIPRVNLLPPSELERRAASRLIRRWVAALALTAVTVSGVVAAAHWVRGTAALELAAEQAHTTNLNTDLAGLSNVSQALAQRSALTQLRTDAMGNDVEWRALFRDIEAAIPKGAQITALNFTVGTNPVTDADPSTSIGVIGQLTLHTEDPADQNRTVDKLRELDIALAADAGSLSTAGEDGYTFVVDFVVDQSHYSGAYVAPGGAR